MSFNNYYTTSLTDLFLNSVAVTLQLSVGKMWEKKKVPAEMYKFLLKNKNAGI